jgi:two-component system CheB/CheR fusion protein
MPDGRDRGLTAFPIVGIGASAGGLEAFEHFFRACPAECGMGFVLVPHLDPGHASLLSEILQRSTTMPVLEASDLLAVAANHVYIIPPNREMGILNGVLQLAEPTLPRGQRLPIDAFLRALADDQAERAIGIILSGTASDGTLGLRAILGAGGVCMVQEPSTAAYDGMPQSAIAAGAATHILPVEQMPALLLALTRQADYRYRLPRLLPPDELNGLKQILLQLRQSTGHDFALYKKGTISRRIARRMALQQIETMPVYARFLKQNPLEVQALFKELLINVTSFFRDAEAFVALKDEILPPLLAARASDAVFRVWVAGCASGEEAYSIAIVLHELMDENHQDFPVQIYATDLDDDAIATARMGRYPSTIRQDLSPERLRRFFSKDETGYKIKKEIRDRVVFAVQSVIKDPPFTRLDLLSCRNLLIYLEPEQQNRLIPNFHYALKPGGVLFLSSSENITHHPELFTPLNRKWKFYRANATQAHPNPTPFGHSTIMNPFNQPAASPLSSALPGQFSSQLPGKARTDSIADLSNRLLLQSYAPPSATTDAQGHILYLHGDTSRYLRAPPGPLTHRILDMARDGLQLDLRAALQAAAQGRPTLNRAVTVSGDNGPLAVSLSVRLLPALSASPGTAPLLLVSFQELVKPGKPQKPTARRRGKGVPNSAEQQHRDHLERELAYARENMQATSEAQQATHEELKSTNEELQSTNEELQSSNEELETSKEELQSLNEETLTVNSELNAKIEQSYAIENDLKNLLDNITVGTLFLDQHLNIRSYTRAALKVYPLLASDVGRSLGDIKLTLKGVDLLADLQSVLDTLLPRERELRSSDGACYLARMQPYRTLDNIIDGVVLTFTDITEISQLRAAAQIRLGAVQQARELAEGIVNTVVEPLLVLDDRLQVVSASQSFYRVFQVTATETLGRKLYALGDGQWDIPLLRQLLEDLLPKKQAIEGYVVEHSFPGIGAQRLVLNARRIIIPPPGDSELILLALVATDRLETPS